MAEKKKKLTKAERDAEYAAMVYDNWQFNRERGKFQFILKFGVISWGFFTFVIYWGIMLLLNALFKMGAPVTLQLLLITGVGFVLAGIVYGQVLWSRNEKIFLKRYPYGRVK
mgnify:CR=1 FL=1